MQITLPSNWNYIKLDKFPHLYDILKDDSLDGIDKKLRVISILSDVPVIDLENLSLDQLKQISNKIDYIFSFEFKKPVETFVHKGYVWKINYDVSKISGGDFLSLSKLSATEDDVINNLPKIVAIFCKPYKRKWFKLHKADIDNADELLSSIDVGTIYPIAVFFCNLLTTFYPIMEAYLSEQLTESKKKMEDIIRQSKINTQSIGTGT